MEWEWHALAAMEGGRRVFGRALRNLSHVVETCDPDYVTALHQPWSLTSATLPAVITSHGLVLILGERGSIC